MYKRYRIRSLFINFITVIVLTSLIGWFIFYFSSQALVGNLEESLMDIAQQGATIVEKEINGHLNIIETISAMESIRDIQVPWEQKLEILQSEVSRNSFLRMSIADVYGNSNTNDGKQIYVGDRSYFIKALQGIRNVSEPIVGRVDGKLVTTFAVPIYYAGEVVGVLYATHNAENLNKIMDGIKLGKETSSFITNKEGNIIACGDPLLFNDIYTDLNKVKNNLKYQSILKLQHQIIQSKSGTGEYKYKDVRNYAAFAPIQKTEWFLTVSSPRHYVFRNINRIRIFIVSTTLFLMIILGVVGMQAKYLKKKLGRERIKTRAAINAANLIVIGVNHKGEILDFNLYAEIKTGYRNEEVAGIKTIFDMVPEDNQQKAADLLKKINSGKKVNGFELSLKRKDNSIVHILWNSGISRDKNETLQYIEIIGIDMSERIEYEKKVLSAHEELTALYEELSASEEEMKQQFDELAYNQEQLRKSEERYSFVMEAAHMGIWDYDVVTGEQFYSSRWYDIFGPSPNKIGIGEELWYNYIHPDDMGTVKKIVEDHTKNRTKSFKCVYRVQPWNGNIKWVQAIGKGMWDQNGNLVRMAGSHTDITEKKEYENSIHQLAYFDSLTGLPNRVYFEQQAESVMKNGNSKGALIFIDVDNFKYVNDSFGHPYGDSLIIEVGKRITNIVRRGNIVARLGGDEFIVLLTDVQDRSEIQEYADKLLEALKINLSTRGITLKISVSIGIAIFPNDGANFEELMKNADTAMYRTKESGKKSYTFFDKSMNTAVYERMLMESNLRRAIEDNKLMLHYQPQYDLRTGKLRGYESLLRWFDTGMGYIPPLKFIPLAEETELIIPLGRWVLKNAACFIKKLHQRGAEGLYISVNVSVTQLLKEDFVDMVLETLEECELNPGCLELEITETILMESIESSIEKILELRTHGIKVALDDFGTGYSSLTYLRRIPISTLKIDKAFVHNISKHEADKDITGLIIDMAHSLGLEVVAEGVETVEQLKRLVQQRCDIVQGYLSGKPMTESEVIGSIDKYQYFELEG